MRATLHRNGTVTYWSVTRQVWITTAHYPPHADLAAMPESERERIGRHFVKHRTPSCDESAHFRSIA